MITDHWPQYGLRLRTPRLELRLPDLNDLAQLADLAVAGVHDPAVMPFVVPWTDGTPRERAEGTLKWHWSLAANWSPAKWSLALVAVTADGQVIGTQEISGRDFATSRQVETGSWLGLAHQGQGFGTEMRAAVLALAFTGLGAVEAATEAFDHNKASSGVSHKLGYTFNGTDRHVVRGEVVTGRRMLLTRENWAAARTIETEITGLAPCLPAFGLTV
ncbi:GNAT family N-acetyltransferase [Actinoplanes sp. NPDC051494]|uniref:GNAT family N-acetyltransferase n=1 Tax=Actinoplanes sp. NPDC051494 TaxID=3363907 RepID=UPI003794EAC4